jgi:hypothetical protein
MPITHFAFGSHHRAGDHQKQIASFLEHILEPRALRAFVCPEFQPVLNNPRAQWAVPASARATKDGAVTFDQWVSSPRVALLPVDVWMVSFVDLPFSKLKRWSGAAHYGRLGLAFTSDFVRKANIRPVHYYQYPNLARDPAVLALDAAIKGRSPTMQNLADDLVRYRKPARLWPEINSLFAMLKITEGETSTEIEQLTYSRYDVGYNFEVEHEARKILSEDNRELPFEEADVLAVIVPDPTSQQIVQDFLHRAWTTQPSVMVLS